MVSKVEQVLLVRFPYSLYRLKNGAKLEDVSLSIPGKEKMIETDETLTITLDFETKDYKSGSYGADWDWELNAVFISAHIEPRHSPEYPSPRIFKSIHSRVNLGNVVLYKQTTYDDHRLIHDMLVQQAAMQHELKKMRGCVAALEQERGHREL
ncbi:hypothetical protein Tco_0885736 [Tanacetum coccineum]